MMIIGHKGAAGYAPENTILSFQKAIEIGCKVVELDVRLSKDGEVVVFHDEEVSRVTDGEGFVREMSLIELKKLNCGEGQKIPTLQDVIDFCKGRMDLLIELKAPGTPKKVNQIIVKNNFEKNVTIISFYPELLMEIKELNPSLKLGLLLEEYLEKLWILTEEIPVDFILPEERIVTKEIVEKAHILKKKVFAFTVNREDLANKLFSLGVDGIITDFPGLFLLKTKAVNHNDNF
ncbi:MAG: glycerophosphodiester phosphodiesterase family protein [candidate division WOR-3 bacterium]